jgi:hypothetical protein
MNHQDNEFEGARARMTQLTDMIFDQVRKLAELHQDGVLTDEEFTSKKQELLSRL